MAKIGIMSFAHMHAHSYAACLAGLPNATLSAIWDADPERGTGAARKFGVEFVEELDDFLSRDLDGVIVCSENVKHRSMVEAAANANKWVLCEKPLATTLEDAQAMMDACAQAQVGLGMAFPCRFATTFIEVRMRVQRGEIGEILAASCTNNGRFPGGWFADPALSGGGAVMDHTVHVADLLRWITEREFTKVYCAKGNLFQKDLGTDDVGSLHMEMEGGIVVSHIASWNRPKHFPTWGDVTIELVGTGGIIEIDAFNQKLDVYSDHQNMAEWVGWGDNSDMGLVRDFVDAVDERRNPAVTGLDGLRALEVTLAAYDSAATGRLVTI